MAEEWVNVKSPEETEREFLVGGEKENRLSYAIRNNI
jgi:hypothetical protein